GRPPPRPCWPPTTRRSIPSSTTSSPGRSRTWGRLPSPPPTTSGTPPACASGLPPSPPRAPARAGPPRPSARPSGPPPEGRPAMLDPAAYSFNGYALPLIVVVATALLLGGFVLVRERLGVVSIAFGLAVLSASYWLFCFAALYTAARP